MGIIKAILMLIGAVFVMRFMGQVNLAKRNKRAENALRQQKEAEAKQKAYIEKNKGKVHVIHPSGSKKSKTEDVDYEEM